MRAKHRLLEETERIAQDRLGFLLKALDEQPHTDLCGDLAARVTAHAIGDDQQQRVAPICVGEPILIDLPRALARILKNREPHTSKTTLGLLLPRALRADF